MLGVFWIYDNQVFTKKQALSDIEPINGFKDSNLAHYQVWNEIQHKHPKFYLFEYEDIPRGRVVFNVKNQIFIIYSNDNILNDVTAKTLIIKAFELKSTQCHFAYDEHYQIF